MKKPLLYVLAVAIVGFGSSVLAQQSSDGVNNIPAHLLECYRNNTLYRRENRLPSSMASLIQLITKIEQHPGFNMDLRGLALSLFHMFRVDGIENDPLVQTDGSVTPFRLTGHQFHKYRILRMNLITQSSYLFQNESLSSAEKCSLHFMLSNSIDKVLRGDESQTCNSISSNNRARRDIADGEVDNVKENTNSNLSQSHDNSSTNQSVQVPSDVSKDEEKSEVEVKKSPVEMFKEVDTNSSKKGDMMWNQDGSLDSAPARQTVEIKLSDCPVENGVVYTDWGSVSAGTVLAGIATGLAQESVLIENIRNDGRTYNGASVDNQWAATLGGDLAEVALFQGPYKGSANLIVGSGGNWNSTQIPRWYFITNSGNELTDAEIRGGIDGLIMAKYVGEWSTKTNGNLRLSHLLERYYSERGVLETKYRACNRQDHYTTVTPTETMKEQVYNFALTMSQSTASIPQINETGIKSFTDSAIQKLNSYVPSTISSACPLTRATTTTSPPVRAQTDVYVVLDCSLPHINVINILWLLASGINLHNIGSRITVLNGKNFETLVNSSVSGNDMLLNMSLNIYNACQQGFDIKNLLEVNLKQLFNVQLDREMNDSDYLKSHSKIVLFIPNNFSPTDVELIAAKEAVRDFRDNRPDVKFLYLVSGTSDNIKELVEEQDKDIILTSNLDKLSERIKEVHRRITNSVCGSNWTERSYSTAQITEYVKHEGINYYRINSKYLFGVGSGSVKVQGSGNGELKVCQSRRFERPNNSTNSDGNSNDEIQCKQITNDVYEISLLEPCGGHEYVVQCPPLYISVESTGNSAFSCSDLQNCRDFADIMFTISHTGLTCGVGRFLANSNILILAAVLVTSFKMFFSS